MLVRMMWRYSARAVRDNRLALFFFLLFEIHRGLFVSFLGILPGLCGVFHGLSGVLVPGKVLSLAVLRRCCSVRVRGHLVKFSRSLMRIVVHICSSVAS